MEEESNGDDQNDILVSNFDYSFDNFLASMDSIRELCGFSGEESFDAGELERFSSMITFLKEWKYFVYEPKNIKFAWEGDERVKGDFDGISLPQFSSATVPKVKNSPDEAGCLDSDFVLNAGGLTWAMDWCPRNLEKPENIFKCEYLAVAAHPPGSTYHKIGVPLTGRGIIQIWCLLSLEENVQISRQKQIRSRRRPRGRPRGGQAPSLTGEDKLPVQRPRGRPKGGQEPSLTGEDELTVRRPRGRPKGTFKNRQVHSLEEKDDLTVRRPGGRPKGTGKNIPRLDMNNLNGNMESALPGNNLALSTSDLVPLSVNLGGTAVGVPVSGALSGNVKTLVPKRRGRPSKKPPTSLSECVPVSENIAALPILPDLNNTFELSVSRGRGRPRKKPTSSGDKCAQAFGVDHGEDVTALPTSRGPKTLSRSIETSPTTGDLDGKLESSPAECKDDQFLKRLRGHPRKQKISNTTKCPPASVAELVENSSVLPASRELGASIENKMMERCQRDEVESCEGMNEMENGSAICIQEEEMNVTSGRSVLFDSTAEQTLPIISGNMLIDTVASENHEGAVPVTNGADEGVPTENFEGPGAPTRASTCRKRRRIKDTMRDFCLKRGTPHLPSVAEHNKLAIVMMPTNEDDFQGEMVLSKELTENKPRIPKDTALPKVVLCLAHMGKVAWDVKWRPASGNESEDKQCLGYLAILLGNGSLEVWEVPLLSMVKILHTSCYSDGTDPRFLKLKPIFRCSKVQCGDRQSIPLTLEWSPSVPHDLILAGCHDGTVAIWKFSKQQSSQDVKPLLCFSADSVPIRSLAWAPDESDAESANLIVTAGHEGIKFWDIRDPYRPLWEYHPVQRIILSLEWLKDPRCLVMSYDDGELRMLSLWNVANDVLVTGEPSATTKQAGLHSYSCSNFAIWSVHVSRATGLAAYCTADGFTRCFQLTAKAVEKDPSRYREPHFLCGSLTSEDQVLMIKTPLYNDPLLNIPWTKPTREMGDAPLYSFLTDGNQVRGSIVVADDYQKLQFSWLSNIPHSGIHSFFVIVYLLGGDQTPPILKSRSKSRCSNKKSSNTKSDPGKPPCHSLTAGGPAQKIEELPPKEVAMHKVRWNMNKGSERWLCYGGSAGIIRCHKISLGTM